jgi:hypothetical protein
MSSPKPEHDLFLEIVFADGHTERVGPLVRTLGSPAPSTGLPRPTPVPVP